MKTAVSLFIILAAFFFVGCAPEKKQQNESTSVKAYRLIDEQRTDEAIQLLETSLREEPDNQDYKIILASAYAHKAGFGVQKLIPLMSRAKSFKQDDALFLKIIEELKKDEKPAQIMQLARLFNQMSEFAKIYNAIPSTESVYEVAYLEQAIDILNKVGKDLKPEDALYRGVLEILLLKHILSEKLIGQINTEIKLENCQVDLSTANLSIIRLGKLLIDIYYDIGIANPSQAIKMKTLAESTAVIVSDLTLAITTVTAIDEAASVFLKQNAIENGFGKLVKCGGN